MKTQKSFFCIVLLLTLLSCSSTDTSWSKEKVLKNKAEKNLSGTGYREFEGKMINYDYVDFGSFRLAVFDNKIKWRGYGGYFDGVVAQVNPQISRVADGIYFMSWTFEMGGGDNVCVNFNTKKVYAHLHQADADMLEDFEVIHGDITCGPSVECAFPEGEVMGQFSTIFTILKNIIKFDLPFMGQTERPLTEQNQLARKELKGKKLQYKTESTVVTIEVKGDVTQVTYKGEETKNYLSYVTKISDGIYFISWLGDPQFSDHIVLNANDSVVFDQLSKSGEHREKIYEVLCFGEHCK
ncbi:hypothetical protein [Flammeovirga sp. SJP92]|uniref:hypothetical protein n=1 Tax=Flammeovirga sp. SJP92 TaxID=1775430 RepID=UPI0012F972D0|nr:hypothetical protein [Flammeovirga sp. SJP92]